jgi:plastocyanin
MADRSEQWVMTDTQPTQTTTPTAPSSRRRVARGAAVAVVAALALTLAACSSGSSASSSTKASNSGSSSSASSSTKTIVIQNFAFHPATDTVAPGSTVTVDNEDNVAHTLTANNGSFNTGSIQPGKSATFTAPTKAGSYGYICSIHQYMTGTLTVS